MSRVAVIDYGMGNLHSAAKALAKVNSKASVVVTSDAEQIKSADRIVFPGVGAIRDCMGEIERLGLGELVKDVMQSKPFLAICVGMQCLLSHSEENGGVNCLNSFTGSVRRFSFDQMDANGDKLKVPHMGWNQVQQTRAHPLWNGIDDNSRFYFVHSYYAQPESEQLIAGVTDYGTSFASVLAKDNVFAVQFHPEKSQHSGLTLLQNFLSWDGQS